VNVFHSLKLSSYIFLGVVC